MTRKPQPKQPSLEERARLQAVVRHVNPPGRRVDYRKRIATTKAERNMIATLRRAVPRPEPAEWYSALSGIRKVTPDNTPPTYANVLVGRGMRCSFSINGSGKVEITLSGLLEEPTEAMIAQAKEDLWPGKEVTHSRMMPGLVHLFPKL